MNFKHDMNSEVKLVTSDETGTVIGRAEYPHADNDYRVRYRAADGRQVEDWWTESAIEPA